MDSTPVLDDYCSMLNDQCPMLTDSKKVLQAVTPAKAGVQKFLVFLDSGACPGPRSGIRRNDRKGRFLTSYETVNVQCPMFNAQCSMINGQ